VRTIWLSAILSRGDHRLVPVAPWVAKRLWTREVTTGAAVTRGDCTDDRLAIVRRRLRKDTRWAPFAAALQQSTVRVYDRSTARVPVDSTSASGYATVRAGGLCQCGHSKDERPDLPQVQVRQAVLDPLGIPLATAVVSGERADAPLSRPCMERVPARVGRHGLLSVGDSTMASRDTRARSAAAGAFSLCPWPQGQREEGELAAALAAVRHGAHGLSMVMREGPQGQPEGIAAGSEYPVALSLKGEGRVESWPERRVVVRSVRQAQAAEAALRARVAKARAQREALNQRGRGKQRLETGSACRQAVVAIGQRSSVADLLWLRLPQHHIPRPVRA
jgi:hypothetical protein